MDARNVKIDTPHGQGSYHFAELGFKDKRANPPRPSELWMLLLLFAKNHGIVTLRDATNIFGQNKNIKSMISRLNKQLQGLFGIKVRPITKKHPHYKAALIFSDQTIVVGNTETEITPDRLEILSVMSEDQVRGGGTDIFDQFDRHDDDEGSEGSRW